MGDVEFDRPAADEPQPPRLMLHAYKIEFRHPGTGREMRFIARVPKDMREFWESCR